MLIVLSYYIITFFLNIKYKNDFLYFDEINNYIENEFKKSYDIFLPILRELELYEKHLTNCTKFNGFYKMNIPKMSDIKIPKIENVITYIIDDKDFKLETKEIFSSIFNEDVCANVAYLEQGKIYCENFWSGILLKGLRQALTYLGVTISDVIGELQSLNNINSGITLFGLLNESSFFDYKVFNEIQLFRIYDNVKYVFLDFRKEKLSAIFKVIKYILIIYIILTIFLSIFFIYFFAGYKTIFNSFLNFIGIIPEKFLEEDNNIYKTIINYGKKFF